MLNLEDPDIASAVEYAASQLAQRHPASRVREDLIAQGTAKEIAIDVVRTVLRRHRRRVRRIGLMQLAIGVGVITVGLLVAALPLLLIGVRRWAMVALAVTLLGGTYAAVGAFKLITGFGGTSTHVPNLAEPPIPRGPRHRR